MPTGKQWLLLGSAKCVLVLDNNTLRTSLSGTLLQTLPELVAPLKGHSLSSHSCPLTLSAPPKGLGISKTAEATQRPSTPVNMRYVCPGVKKKEFHLDSNYFGFT